MAPSLSTIAMPLYEMGQRAVGILVATIKQQDAVPDLVATPPQLVIRESTDGTRTNASDGSPGIWTEDDFVDIEQN